MQSINKLSFFYPLSYTSNFTKKNGFTIFEIIIAVAILSVLSLVTISNFYFWNKKKDVDNNIQEFANILRLAQNRTISSENSSQYGVYINTAVNPNSYILFSGVNYASRIISADQVYLLTKSVEFFGINLSGGGSEIVFDKLTGASAKSGDISIRSKSDTSQIKTIYITNSGTINFSSNPVSSDTERLKDSRHINFDYSRLINTTTENITLDFGSGENIQNFSINNYLIGSQIEWSGTFPVGGEDQTVRIHTIRLNNPDTKFSIHRDRRFNNKSLKITISGDASGNLINYSFDGTSVNSLTGVDCSSGAFQLSNYVSNCLWQ